MLVLVLAAGTGAVLGLIAGWALCDNYYLRRHWNIPPSTRGQLKRFEQLSRADLRAVQRAERRNRKALRDSLNKEGR